LALLASLTYGALYMLLGVLFLRRALVVAVAYTFLMEFIVSFIPAVVHQITVQYHLRCLLAKWLGWTRLPHHVGLDEQLFFSTAPAWHHVLVLLGMTAGLLSAAILVLRQRELVKPTGD
jgi:ABC-type transport system involved in multi-copper enzyme maturation permease subunit